MAIKPVFDLATLAEVNPKTAKSALDRYVRELEGEKLVSSVGQVNSCFSQRRKHLSTENSTTVRKCLRA